MNVDISVGIKENPAIDKASESLDISPNPTDGLVIASYSIGSGSNLSVFISDISGRVVVGKELGWKDAGEYRCTFNLEGLSRGIYFISLKTDRQEVTKKLVVN